MYIFLEANTVSVFLKLVTLVNSVAEPEPSFLSLKPATNFLNFDLLQPVTKKGLGSATLLVAGCRLWKSRRRSQKKHGHVALVFRFNIARLLLSPNLSVSLFPLHIHGFKPDRGARGKSAGKGGGQLVIPPYPPDGPSGGVPDLLWYVAKVICSTVCPSRAHAEFILHVPVLPDGGGGEGGGFLDLKRVICDLTASIRSDTAGMMHFRPYKCNA